MRTRPLVLALVAAMLAVLVGAAASANTTGGITPQPSGCLAATATPGCTTLHDAQFPRRIAVTPDGKHAYAGDYFAHHILVFDRNPATGALVQKPGAAGCVALATPTCTPATGLGNPSSLTVSPDGKHLYVTSSDVSTLIVLSIGSTGALTPSSCLSDLPAEGCTDVRALGFPEDVKVSPDGASVYVASSASDSIAIFARNTATGSLSQLVGASGCLQYNAGPECTADQRLDGVRTIAIPSNGTVIASSYTSRAVVWYGRVAGGALSGQACVAGTALAGCTVTTGLVAVYSVLARGSRVYVATGDSILVFDRPPAGAPTYRGCVGSGGGCVAARGMQGGMTLAADGQGTHVFAAAPNPDHGTVMAFHSTTTGLVQVTGAGGCRYSGPVAVAGCAPVPALTYANDAAVSPDGRFLLVAGGESVTSLRIDARAPVCAARSVRVGKNNPTAIQLVCRDSDGDPMVVSIVSKPAKGTLGAINQTTDRLTYTPPKNFLGRTSFRYRATSTNGVVGSIGTVSVSVAGCSGHVAAPGRHWIGTAGANRFVGGAGRDVMCGGGGNDVLIGKGGADLLLGGAGKDRCLGGPGADVLRSCERRR